MNAKGIDWVDEKMLDVTADSLNLGHIAFFARYSIKDDMVPLKTKESWEMFRRAPTMWSYNSNKKNYTSFDIRKKPAKRVVTKNNAYEYEIATVVFKDISFDPQIDCSHSNSISYFLSKALINNDLDIIGVRMVYHDDAQRKEYYNLFHQAFETGEETWDKPVLAIALRGLEAQSKVDSILGHFNPEMARRTEEKSLRAIFGRSRLRNCVMQVFNR